jgi:uncharacterized repeat protein (TIGR01451 family)
MNSSAQHSKPNSLAQTSGASPFSEALSSACCHPSKPFAWVVLLAGLLLLLFSAPASRAEQSPPGCTGSGLSIFLFTDSPDVHIGDTLQYSVTVLNGTGSGPIVCDATSITAEVTTPDGISHPVTLVRTSLSNGQSDYYSNVVSYVVRAVDVRSDGTVRATASDTGVIHQNDTNSQGGGNQGVNTEVSLPCIQLLVQCLGGVGVNGALAFTGTVTNCGNNTLVGVTVTNFVNGGQFHVTFITNLLAGQIATFTGSWVPANPCSPSTATLVAQGIDQFTTHPRTVTSSVDTTCSEVLTPGIKVTKACPAQPVSPGQLLTFSGSVSNTGNVTLTNIVVVNNRPTANTAVFTVASLAPGAEAAFSGSYLAPTNCSVSDTLTARATTQCGAPVSDSASATCPIRTTPQIAVNVSCPAIPAASGGTLAYNGTVRNVGDITLTNIVVLSDRPALNTTVFTVASLAPGALASFTSSVAVPADACSVTTTFSGRGQDACLATTVTNTVATTCPITTAPAIAVTLACPAVPTASGAAITYNGTVRNSGNISLNNVVVVEAQATPSTVLTLASLAPGASANFTASFTAPATGCSVSSTVTARGSDACTATMVTNTASATCPLSVTPRLIVTESCSPTPASPGGLLTYSGSLSNAGNTTLTNLVVTNDRSGATPVFATASLLPGAMTNFTGSYTVPAGTACSVTSVLTATGRDVCAGNPVSATDSATCPVSGTALIAVTLNCPAVPVTAGAQITYAGAVSNPGNVTLSNVVVVNTQSSPSTVLSVPSLAPGATANFTSSFTSPANACSVSSTVTARASAACSGSMVTNTASTTCALLTASRIVVTQTCPPTPASPGGLLTYSGTVSNAGNITLTNVLVVDSNQPAPTTNPAPASFGTLSPSLAPLAGTATDRFVVGNNFNGLTYADQDEGYAATQFYSLRHETSGNSTFVTINAAGTVTGRFDAGNKNFDALTFAAPDVGYGPVIFYYLRHDNAGVSSFGTIKPGGTVGVVADLFVAGTNLDALTFAATDVGFGANLFYYLRHDTNGRATFGTINPALPGTVTDRFNVGTNFDALVFTATDVGYGANLFYYLRHDSNGRSTFGTISTTGTVTDRYDVGTNFNELAFSTTDVGFGANLFYYLQTGGHATGTNTLVQPVFATASLAPGATANFTGSYTVPSLSACSVTTILSATATDLCSGNTVTNTSTLTCPLLTAPRIEVTLNCPAVPAIPGGLVTFAGTVSNPGNVTLNNVVVIDNQASPSTVLTVASLAPGSSAGFTATFTAPTNACAVSSTVSARGSDGCTANQVTNVASIICPLSANPRLVVTESCSGGSLSPAGLLAYSGSVSNAGNLTLTNIVVTNDRSGNTPVFTAASLAPHAMAHFTGSYAAPAGACSVTSVLTATAKDTCSGSPLTDTASATCPIATAPGIEVTQTCPANPVSPGGLLTYSGTVSNSGSITLTNIIVVNNRSATNTVILTVASLAPGAWTNFTGSYRVPLNCCVSSSTVTATGQDLCSGFTVVDTFTSTCTLLTTPRIVVTKVCPAVPVAPGELLHYSGTVSNAGDIALVNVTVVKNNQPGTNSPVLGPITLAPGEMVTYYASYVVSGDFCGTDTVTARGLDTCSSIPVTSSVTTTCPTLASPRIAVTKNCPPQPTPRGGVFTFTGTVSNPGNVTLNNVFVVNDYQLDCYSRTNGPVIGPITLAPGASVNFSGSYPAPWSCCQVLDILTATGQDRCASTLVTASAAAECPLLSSPRIAVVEHCPAGSVAVGEVYAFTGSVTNLGDVVLTNVYVVSSQPVANTPLLGPIELAPGEGEEFSGSYLVTAGASPANAVITTTGIDTCQGRTVTAAANCSGPLTPTHQPRALTLVIVGNGTVTGVADGQLLNIGQSYTAKATPAAGSTFGSWSGPVSGTSPSLTFAMQSNLVLTANFLFKGTNEGSVFNPVAGVFNGLFFDTNELQTTSSGYFSLTMTAAGTYKATLLNKGKSYPVRGTFDAHGQATNSIHRTGASPLTVNWQGNLTDSDALSGTVSDGSFVAQLEGARDVFRASNPAPQAGRHYTLAIPGLDEVTNSPVGNGYGTATVGANGVVHFLGRLADNTAVVQNVALAKNSQWPVFVSLYQGKGLLIGWLQFADDGTNDLSGTLRWMKPNLPTSKLYKPGFSVNSEALGSQYVAPLGTASLLQITNGVVVLSGGALPDSSNLVTFGLSSKLVNNGPNVLKLTFTRATGVFSGTFKEAGTTTTFVLKGAVLQRQNNGSGYAPGAAQSGRVVFHAVP